MDTLTHALTGALAARATAPDHPAPGQLTRRGRMWVGFSAAAFPDSDFIVRFIDPLLYLTSHRGITHSVIMLPLWAAGLAWLFWLFFRGQHRWREFVAICALGIGIHILGDVITAFGTMVFAPLSDWRAQIPTTFIIDPYFTAILVAGLVASAVWPDTRRPAFAGFAVLVLYVGFQAVMQSRAVSIGEDYVRREALNPAKVQAIPQPFSPFNWMIVVTHEDTYHIANASLVRREPAPALPDDAGWFARIDATYRPTNSLAWRTVARFGEEPSTVLLARHVWNSPDLRRYRQFTLFPALLRVDRNQERVCAWFQDLRFWLAGRNVPFRYGACRRVNSSAWQVFRLLDDGNGNEIIDAVRVQG